VSRLSDIHRDVGTLEEVVDVGPVLGGGRKSDAGLHREGQAAEVHLTVDDLSNPFERGLGGG
jgi:hypothetical protein